MPQIYWIHFLLQLIPEAFITILCGYAFQGKKIGLKFLVSGILLSLIIYIVNFAFPVSKQMATILSFTAGAIILILINKIEIIKAILSTILLFVLFIIAEAFNFVLLKSVFHLSNDKIQALFDSYTLERWQYGLPSLLLKLIIVVVFYFIMVRVGKKKNAAVE